MHDAELDGVVTCRAQVHVGNGMQLGQRIGQAGGLGLPAVERGRTDLLKHFEEELRAEQQRANEELAALLEEVDQGGLRERLLALAVEGRSE